MGEARTPSQPKKSSVELAASIPIVTEVTPLRKCVDLTGPRPEPIPEALRNWRANRATLRRSLAKSEATSWVLKGDMSKKRIKAQLDKLGVKPDPDKHKTRSQLLLLLKISQRITPRLAKLAISEKTSSSRN